MCSAGGRRKSYTSKSAGASSQSSAVRRWEDDLVDTAANLRSGRTQAFATWADVTGVAMAA
jgi:hypothetical protein